MQSFPSMDVRGFCSSIDDMVEQEMTDVKKGPWTAEEDTLLMNYVTIHGEGRWNSVAHFAGLKRTGKSCRLRWLNYLRPDLRRGNMTLQEQLLILELHSRWGNRWSKIAQYLPGRTDNEIKNYWRTRVQKQAKQLKCDVNSKQFRDTLQYVWMPRLREQIQSSLSKTNSMGQPQSVETYPDTIITSSVQTLNQSMQTNLSGYEVFDPSGFVPELSGCTSNDSSLTHANHVSSDPSDCHDQWSETLSDNGSGLVSGSFTGYDGCGQWLGAAGVEDHLMMMMDNWWIEDLKHHLFDDDF